jgi:WD40 repeat protein
MDDRHCGYCDAMVHPSHQQCPHCGRSLLLNGRYRLLQRLGEGGSGVVYAAIDTKIHNRLCAIKRMRANPDHEIRIFVDKASRFAFIPHVYERWSDPPFHFYVMEYIGGETLDHVRPLPWPAQEVEGFLRTLLGYLVQLHGDGIVHRDLKPANIKYTPQGRAEYMLLDFGIAKRIGDPTSPNLKAATRYFAPPEQQIGESTDERADLYSLAATAYLLLTGRVARETIGFERDTLVLPSQFVPDVPSILKRMLVWMLRLDSDQRPASARDALAALDAPKERFPPPLPPSASLPLPGPSIEIAPTVPAHPQPKAQLSNGSIVGVGWAADGRELLVASTLGPTFYDAQTLQKQRQIETRVLIRPGMFAQQNERFALTTGRAVQIWQTNTGALLHTLHADLTEIVRVVLAPDGRTVVVVSREGVRAWRDGMLLPSLQGDVDGRLALLAVTADGETLATASGVGVQLWRLRDGAPFGSLPQPGGQVWAMAFAPDGQVLAVAAGTTVQVYRISDKTLQYTLEGHSTPIVDLAFAPNGLTLASASNDAIKLWRVRDRAPRRALPGEPGGLVSISFAPDGQTLAAAAGERVRLWSVGDGTLLRTLRGYMSDVQDLAFAPDGQSLAVAGGSVHLWQIDEGALLSGLEDQHFRPNSLAFSPDRQSLAVASDAGIKLWRISDRTLFSTLGGRTSQASSLVFAADGQRLIAAESDAIRVWNANTGTLWASQAIDTAGLYAIALAPDGRMFAAVYDRSIQLWHVDEDTPFYQLDLAGDINSVALARDGETLAVAMDDALEVWRVRDGDEDRLHQLPHGAQRVVFSPDGGLLASAWHTRVGVWDVTSGTLMASFDAHRDSITALAFSPDMRLLATAAQEGAVRLWEIQR